MNNFLKMKVCQQTYGHFFLFHCYGHVLFGWRLGRRKCKMWMECQSTTHATQKKCLLQPDFLHWNIMVIYSWDIWSFWNISVICLTVVLKLTTKVFFAYIFKHSDQNDSIYFGHFKNVSIYDRNKNRLQPQYWINLKDIENVYHGFYVSAKLSWM